MLGAALLFAPRVAKAGPNDAILLPAAIPEQAELVLHPERADLLAVVAREVDSILSEAVQDLGLTLTVSDRSREVPSDDALIERAHESWVVSPRVSFESGDIRLLIVAVAPGQNVLRERSERVDRDVLEVRANVMMSEVVHSLTPGAGGNGPAAAPPDQNLDSDVPRSQGRAVLALNSALVGGYVGFSLQRASGSDDARLTYPLVALGSGIGLGASMLIADEWDITLGDAWFLSAGAWWPIASGVLLAKSYRVQKEDRYVYGLVAGAVGVSLSTAVLTLKPINEGGAALTHSGAAVGTLIGGLTEMAYRGTTDETPERGIGYGAGAGVLLAGALATQVHVTSSRVLLIDLAASLGALTGAAAASPLLLVREKESATRNRLWLAGIGAGTLIGGGVGWLWTRGSHRQGTLEPTRALPYFAFEPADASRGTRSFMSLGVQGLW